METLAFESSSPHSRLTWAVSLGAGVRAGVEVARGVVVVLPSPRSLQVLPLQHQLLRVAGRLSRAVGVKRHRQATSVYKRNTNSTRGNFIYVLLVYTYLQ